MRTETTLVLAILSLGVGCGEGISTYDDVVDETQQAPSLVLEADTLDLGIAEDIGVRLSSNISIQNTGGAPLNISDVSVDAPFSTGLTSIIVNPGSNTQLSVNYDPTEYVDSSAILTILSDDPDRPSVEVSLAGAVVLDGDGDGFERSEAGGDDCDDEDGMVYPGAEELYYDGIDQNCDGLNDYDQDLDGYEAEFYGGEDCNDLRDWIYPGAEDDFYDGVDSNCDGADDWDADQDGFRSEALGKGRDCDDADDDAYPGAPERLNGRVDDCDSDADVDRQIPAAGAHYGFTGSGAFESVGMSMAAGDLDNDGLADVFVGAPYKGSTSAAYGPGGVAVLLSGSGMLADGSEIWDAWHFIEGSSSNSGLGAGLAYLDADFSGSNSAAEGSLVLGAPGENSGGGAIYVVPGEDIAASGDLGDTTLHIKGIGSLSYGYEVGREIVDNLDLDGDGQDDLLFGYSSRRRVSDATSSFQSIGTSRIGLEYGAGGVVGTVNISSVDARWYTSTPIQFRRYASPGYVYWDNPVANNLSEGGDLNGDGYDDWVFGDPTENDSSGSPTIYDSGVVWALWGQGSEYQSSISYFDTDASTVAAGGSGDEMVGLNTGILPDMDGDGKDELFWWQRSSQGYDQIHVLSGADVSSGGMLDANDAVVTLEYGSGSLKSMASIGDWDGDNVPEWAVHTGTNRIHIYPGAGLSGTYSGGVPILASMQASSREGNVDFGASMLAADIDGNGTSDWFVGDEGFEGDIDGDGTPDEAAGAVYIFLNNGL